MKTYLKLAGALVAAIAIFLTANAAVVWLALR